MSFSAQRLCYEAVATPLALFKKSHGAAMVLEKLSKGDQTARLENAFNVAVRAESAEKKIRSAYRAGSIKNKKGLPAWDEALGKKIVSQEEYRLLTEADKIRFDAILVDDFSEKEYQDKMP